MKAEQALSVEARSGNAVSNGDLELYCQAGIDPKNGRLVGAVALASRMDDGPSTLRGELLR